MRRSLNLRDCADKTIEGIADSFREDEEDGEVPGQHHPRADGRDPTRLDVKTFAPLVRGAATRAKAQGHGWGERLRCRWRSRGTVPSAQADAAGGAVPLPGVLRGRVRMIPCRLYRSSEYPGTE